MKLSEAIMLGSMTGPQIRGLLSNGEGTCALGAAYRANGVFLKLPIPRAFMIWPWLKKEQECPVCKKTEREVTFVITSHLNDTHKWTRERIAEWVSMVEPKEEAQKVESEATKKVSV